MGAQDGPWPACFAPTPLAIYEGHTLLGPAPSTWCSACPPKAPQGPEPFCPRCLHFLQSISLPAAVLSSSPLISQQRDATGRLSSRLKASNVDSTSQTKASCRLCEKSVFRLPLFFPSSLLGLSRCHSFPSSVYRELGWSSSRHNFSPFYSPFFFFVLTSTTSFPLVLSRNAATFHLLRSRPRFPETIDITEPHSALVPISPP